MSLVIALPKGRLLAPALELLARAGIEPVEDPRRSRKLILEGRPFQGHPLRFLVMRAMDVATFVERGAADCGIVGRDLLLEQRPRVLEPISLGIGRCRLVVAARNGARSLPQPGARVHVATKYGRLAREWFAARGVEADIVKLYGSIELAPLVGLADYIVDLVETGRTLKENDLAELATIAPIESRWIVNPGAMATKHEAIAAILEAVAGAKEEA
ncbi:MAG: ATP phosphoribosyltransferase [Zetaproteobacteria bacterium]|nr:MAG: ATP phosphoribosyltransferase [Zetaproteobacteria bacterium]